MTNVPPYRNQSIDFLCISIDWFIYEGENGPEWVNKAIMSLYLTWFLTKENM